MAKTPDRRPGILQEDEEIQFYPNPTGPSTSGAFNYDGDEFVFRDSTGSFNPRGGGVFTVSGSSISTVYTASFFSGLSGSLTQLSDGTSFVIATPGITVASSSNGSIILGIDDSIVATISGSTFTGGVAIDGNLDVNGGDIKTTSTTFNLINTNANTVYFAGDATLLNIGSPTGTNVIEGQTQFSQGLSGSLTKLANGTSYLIAGTNISITTGSSGAVTVSATGASPTGLAGGALTGSYPNPGLVNRPVLVFQPGSPSTSDNVFTTWSSLMTAFSGSTGQVIIEFDTTYGAATIPVGTHDLQERAIIQGTKTSIGAPPVITLPDGAIFKDPKEFYQVELICQGTTAPNCQLTNDNIAIFSLCYLTLNGTQPFIRLSGSDYVLLQFDNLTVSVNTPASALVDLSSSTSSLSIYGWRGVYFANDNIITGVAGSELLQFYDSSVLVGGSVESRVPTNPNFLGTTTTGYLDNSNLVAFDDSVVTNLLNTNTVQGALDELKRRQYFLSTTPNSIYTTSSVAIKGSETGIDSPLDKGTDVFFYVSGSLSGASKSLFGGNVVSSGSIKALAGFSGSLTKLVDDTSYIRAGDYISVVSSSNGAITISGNGIAPAGSSFVTIGNDANLTSERALTSGTGLVLTDGGANSTVTLAINDAIVATVSGTTFTGVTKHNAGLSGSLTQLVDGTSYIRSGDYISVSSASNGSITVSGVGIAPVGSSFVTIGNDATLTNERSLTAGTGLILTDAGANSTVTLSINDSIVATVSGTTFTGATKHSSGLSGSLTQLVDGTSYIIAGSGISVASQSNGPITISNIAQYPPGGAQGQVQYYDSGNFAGSSQFTFSPSNGAVTASILVGTTISGSSVVSGSKVFAEVGEVNQYLRINGSVDISSIPTSTVDSAFLYVSGTNRVLHFAHFDENENNVSITDIHSYDGLLQTGLRWGGFLSTAPGSTTFSITSGSGQVVRYNTSPGKEPEPFIKEVRWGNIVSQSMPYVASSQFTYVAIDENLNVLQQAVPYTLAGSGDVIFLGRVNHPSSTTINAVMFPETTYGQPAAFLDFARAFGPLKVSGHVLTPSGSSMRVKKSGGDSFIIGGNYLYNQDTPSYITSAEDQDKDAPLYVYSWVSGSTFLALTNAGVGYTVLDPNKYVSGSTLTAVPAGKFSNLRVYYQPRNLQGYLTVYYGNDYYDTLTDAVNGIDQESFTEHPTTQLATIFCGYVSVQSGSADLSDPAQAQIKQAGLFRTTAGISVAGGGGGGGGGTPGGLDTYVQYNQGGTVFAGDAQFTYNAVTNVLTVGNAMIGGTGELMGSGVSFDLLDTTVQTINFGGAATTIDLGSTGGTNNLFGATKMPQGLSGSLTQLTDGSSYLISSGNISITSASNGAVTVGTTAINSTEHTTLRQLIHLAEEGGPFEGFALGSYRESLPTGDPFPTSVIWWETSAKLKKIVEETVTYNSQKLITTDEWKVYNTDGVTVAKTATDTISYSGVFETNRTRTIT